MLTGSSKAKDWLQKNGPFQKDEQIPIRKLAKPLNMLGWTYAEAHKHKKPSPERLKEKWVAKIGGKGKEKVVVATVLVAESERVKELRSEDGAE